MKEEHIGDLIKRTLDEGGHTVQWLAQKIHCQRRNVYGIFNRDTMNTDQLLKISLALKTNLFLFFSEKMDKNEFASPQMCCTAGQDDFHIGALIKNKLEEDGRKVEWLAKQAKCQRRSIYYIMNKRRSIDTRLLMEICKALKMNFFECFCVLYENRVN